jgi:hypothetical protein
MERKGHSREQIERKLREAEVTQARLTIGGLWRRSINDRIHRIGKWAV